jgi:itaconate CoA-transferase
MLPYEGLLVLSLEQAVAAPLCTSRLADAGARVIKIERPEGDFAREYDHAVHGHSAYFLWTNRGKESICLDLKSEPDRALIHRMLERADVFVQNLVPGAAERLGLGAQSLRERFPRLVTCDISGYGDSGPYRDMKAYDFLIQGESGLLAVSGAPGAPGRIGVSLCDIAAGLNALIGIQQALYRRRISGQGASIKVSLFDGAVDWMSVPLLHSLYGGKAPGPAGLHHPSIAPYGGFRTLDGETLLISIQNNREWSRFCDKVLGRPDMASDPRYAENNARVAHRENVDSAVAQAFARLPRAALESLLREADIAYGGINSVELVTRHPQLRTWPMPVGETDIAMVAPPVQADWDTQSFRRAPDAGAQDESIRAEFSEPDFER